MKAWMKKHRIITSLVLTLLLIGVLVLIDFMMPVALANHKEVVLPLTLAFNMAYVFGILKPVVLGFDAYLRKD